MGTNKYSDAQSFEEMAEQDEKIEVPKTEPDTKPAVEINETTE